MKWVPRWAVPGVYGVGIVVRAARRTAIGLLGGRTFGVRMLVERDGHFCLIRHTYGDRTAWMPPGGAVDWREEPEAAAIRETAEEVGITDLSDVRIVHAYRHKLDWGDDVVIVYAARTTQEFAHVSIEIADIIWASPSDLPPDTSARTRASIAAALAQPI